MIFDLISYLIPGVLMWEVFTCGKMPYGRLKNTEVVERVQRGIILERPKASTKEIYDVSVAAEFNGGGELVLISIFTPYR